MKMMENQIIEIANDIANFHMSQMTFTQSWDDISVGSGDSFVGDAEHEVKKSIQKTCECIDDALAILPSPLDETKQKVPPLPSRMPIPFDSPPCCPRRSFDLKTPNQTHLSRSVSDKGHDRFQLTRSEHISGSFRAPKRPIRSTYDGNDSICPYNERPNLTDSVHSPRDVTMRPPLRTPSTKGAQQLGLANSSEQGKVTLRASGNRILKGSRELPTSQHLRRRCPSSRLVAPSL